jgi:hypothetical protein
MSAPLGGEEGGALGPAPWCSPAPGPGELLRRQLPPRSRRLLCRWRKRRSTPVRDHSFWRWSCRSGQTSSPWRRGTAGTFLGRARRRSPTPRTRARWRVAARWWSRGTTCRRRKRWDPCRPEHGSQGEPRVSPHRCWRRRRTLSWHRADRWGSVAPIPSAPPSGWRHLAGGRVTL